MKLSYVKLMTILDWMERQLAELGYVFPVTNKTATEWYTRKVSKPFGSKTANYNYHQFIGLGIERNLIIPLAGEKHE